jgi:hypothetical protein
MIATATNLSTEKKKAALDEVLASKTFARSDQLRSFLTYVCEKEIAGKGSEINEYVIAVEALGRPATYSSGEEATVRNRAYQLRHKLLEYYSLENTTAAVRIELPKGSYCPVFIETETPAVIPEELAMVQDTEPAIPDSMPRLVAVHRPRWLVFALLSLVAVMVIVFSLSRVKSQKTALEEFWQPVVNSQHPVLICITQSVMYHLAGKAKEMTYQKLNRLPLEGQIEFDLVPDEQISSADVRAQPYYVMLGSALASAKLSTHLAHSNKSSQIRTGDEASFNDLRQAAVITLGAFGNRWTMSVANNQRFYFGNKPSGGRAILDRTDPIRFWTPPDLSVSGIVAEDYVLITRIFESETGNLLISAAGVTQFGTRAAGEFLTTPANFEALAKQAPDGWQKKNLQIVFTVKVLDNTPGPPTILATHFW